MTNCHLITKTDGNMLKTTLTVEHVRVSCVNYANERKKTAANLLARSFLILNLLIPLINF